MSTDDDEASFLWQPKYVTRDTNDNTDTQVTNWEGYQAETVCELPHVQNDSTQSLIGDLGYYGSTNQGVCSNNNNNTVTSGNEEAIDSSNQEEDSGLFGESTSSNESAPYKSRRKSIARRVSRSSSVVVCVAPPSDEYVYKPFSFWRSSRQQKLLLVSMATVDFTSNMCLSILAPFFPDEALTKGVNNTISGWIFGVFALVQFISSPIFGKLLPRVGARYLFLAGQFFGGGCTVLFGLLDYISVEDGPDLFIVYCFVLRSFLALGCAASGTASFAITASAFPDNVGTVFGLLETFTGLGLMVGPALGGVMFEVGGFVTPFAVLGGIMVLTVPINIYILPKPEEGAAGAQAGSIFQLLRIPSIFVVSIAVMIGTMAWAILDPTLQPHLVQFDLNATLVGLIFLLLSAFYAISSPIWGWAADRMRDSTPLLIVGFFGTSLALLLIGPSPLLGFEETFNELWLNLVALIILGTFSSLAVIPTFDKIIDACDQAGVEDNMAMYSVVAGLWSAFYALGDFLGPSIGGVMVDAVGFEWSMTYIAGLCALMAFMLLILWLWEKRFGPTPMWGKQPTKTEVPKPEPEVQEIRSPEFPEGDDDFFSRSNLTANERTPLLSSAKHARRTSTRIHVPERVVPDVHVNGSLPGQSPGSDIC